MKRLLFVITILIAAFELQAQVIKGHVYREGSTTPVPHASVYFNGSVIGVMCDDDGFFKLNVGHTKLPLVISSVGYYSETLNDYSPDKEIIVYLKPKMLAEVRITPSDVSNDIMVTMFRHEFLGTSALAQSCEISNMDDIDMNYVAKTRTFTVSANKPILIRNKTLGYTITYYLDKFVRTGNHLVFDGNYKFEADSLQSPAELKAVKKNREDAYAGSRMQFIRLLWNGNLKDNGYQIMTYDSHRLTEDSIVVTSNGQKYVRINKWMRIVYKLDYDHQTFITPTKKFSFIGPGGFYDTGLSWSGLMAQQRVGDLLPFEYVSEKDKIKMVH